jgi:hypothetical protein
MNAGTVNIEASRTPTATVEPCWDELERVTHSSTFSKSPRLASLLLHICERSWSGRTDELSEQQIGIHFFHHPPGFNAGEDAIVRGTARHLRKRLELYYETEGRKSTHRISVPKGGYVSRFEALECPVETSVVERPFHAEEPSSAPSRFQLLTLGIVAVSLVIVLVAGYLGRGALRRARAVHSDGPTLLWKSLFQPNHRTVIVPGDSSLNLYTAYKHRPVSLTQYTNQSYQQDQEIAALSPEGPGLISRIDTTTMADLQVVSNLVRVPYREALDVPDANIEIRYARDVNEADLRGANLILIGASSFDPRISVYDNRLDFQLERNYEHYTFRVLNRVPKPGEEPIVTRSDGEALTIVALTGSLSGKEHVLLIEGSTMGSVYAALHFLMTDNLWRPVINAASTDGTLHNFEVLLKSDLVKDEVSSTRVVAWHVH